MAVSDVGRMAMGSSRSDEPARVTHATSGAKPSMWFFSRSSTLEETNMGKYAFSTPRALICVLNHSRTVEHAVAMLQDAIQTLNGLPDGIRPGLEDIATTDAVVVEHVCIDQNLATTD